METRKKVYLVIFVVVLTFLSFGAGRFSKASRVEIVTKEVVKEVIKEVFVKKEKKNQITTTDRVIKPDGTVTERTTTTDNGTVDTTNTTDTTKESTKVTNNTTIRDSGLTVNALLFANPSNFKEEKIYGLEVSKRVIGNLRMGLSGTSDKKIGLIIGLDF